MREQKEIEERLGSKIRAGLVESNIALEVGRYAACDDDSRGVRRPSLARSLRARRCRFNGAMHIHMSSIAAVCRSELLSAVVCGV